MVQGDKPRCILNCAKQWQTQSPPANRRRGLPRGTQGRAAARAARPCRETVQDSSSDSAEPRSRESRRLSSRLLRPPAGATRPLPPRYPNPSPTPTVPEPTPYPHCTRTLGHAGGGRDGGVASATAGRRGAGRARAMPALSLRKGGDARKRCGADFSLKCTPCHFHGGLLELPLRGGFIFHFQTPK